MCLRYVLPDQAVAEREFLPATAWWKFAEKFNVSAQQYVPAVRVHQKQSEGVMLRWGLIPSWVEGQPDGLPRTRVESSRIESSKSCRTPWINSQRCILPMAGFYVWQLTAEGYRQPHFVRLRDRPVFGVAGIWDRWVSDEDDVIESCTVISVPPNELLSDIAGPSGGMPAILRRKDYLLWLHGTVPEAKLALQPYKAAWMHAHPVSPRVNSAAVDDPALIRLAG
ncbi:MAG: SOS response-associated peptidase [Steroidobacteraceae bacterium]|jgi:putative SOS response-associated peptidase YedK